MAKRTNPIVHTNKFWFNNNNKMVQRSRRVKKKKYYEKRMKTSSSKALRNFAYFIKSMCLRKKIISKRNNQSWCSVNLVVPYAAWSQIILYGKVDNHWYIHMDTRYSVWSGLVVLLFFILFILNIFSNVE